MPSPSSRGERYLQGRGQPGRHILPAHLSGRLAQPRRDRDGIAILLHLAREKARVATPVSRKDGGFITPLDCAEGRRWAALFTCAPGKEVAFHAYSDELAGLYGEGVASVHCAADSFKGRALRPPLDLAELLERPLRLLESTVAHRPEHVASIVGLGDRLRHRVQAMADPEIGFCHGDFHGWNACEKDGAFTFYDFDCCGWGYRAYDLAVFPWALAIGRNSTERIEAMGRAYLKGYLRRRRLGLTDVDAIPAFMAIRRSGSWASRSAVAIDSAGDGSARTTSTVS